MELLKVFVGDAALSSASATKNTMVKGDLLLLDATTHAVADGNSTAVVIAACNDKGVYVSAPITNASIKYLNYANSSLVTPAEATGTATVPPTATFPIAPSTTYSIGVQIKEDLRMGTYNKNTEIIGSYISPATIPSGQDGFYKMEMASTIAKGFAANPLTSAGSPYQLVNVYRQSPSTAFTGAAGAGQNLTATRGSRIVTFTGALTGGLIAGVVLNLGASWYLVEKVETGKITLDTAFQGTSGSVATGTNANSAYFTATLPTTFTFEFDGVAQTQKNRYDQFRVVDFAVITPKGNDAGLITVSVTPPVYPIGSYRQIRDLEEKAYTNSMPLINYREFPFETFPINADPTFTYDILTIGFTTSWGYNMMQSNQSEFLQTVVVAAPRVAQGQFDATVSPVIANNFAGVFNTWYTAGNPFGDIA